MISYDPVIIGSDVCGIIPGLYVLLCRYTTDWSLEKPSLLTTDGFYIPGLPSRPMVEKDICRYV